MTRKQSDTESLRAFINEVVTAMSTKAVGPIHAPGPLRAGVPLTGHTASSLANDEEFDASWEKQSEAGHKKRQASTCLIVSTDDHVLAVSRRDDPTMWGMPGGKVDPGESPRKAAIRELAEETGLRVTAIRHVYTGTDSDQFEVHCFACSVEGEINTDEEGLVKWVHKDVLLDPNTTPWADFNAEAFAAIGL